MRQAYVSAETLGIRCAYGSASTKQQCSRGKLVQGSTSAAAQRVFLASNVFDSRFRGKIGCLIEMKFLKEYDFEGFICYFSAMIE